MKTSSLFAAIAIGFLAGCQSPKTVNPATMTGPTYIVELQKDRIVFRGIDRPAFVADRPDDKVESDSKTGRTNWSRFRRCSDEAQKALDELSVLAKKVDTRILMNSLRHCWDVSSDGIDYYVARDGNVAILAELMTRRPFDPEMQREAEKPRPMGIFSGANGPLWSSVDEVILEFDGLIKSRLKANSRPDDPW